METSFFVLQAPHTPASVMLLGLLGLLIGSFLNVVIYRLPVMMQAHWAAECAELQGQAPPEQPRFNLMTPGSRCPHCQHRLHWYENLPVLSFLVQRAKCRHCGGPISLRYPLVELLTAFLFAYCGWRWGVSGTALVWGGFCSTLLALALIDWDTTLLPDDLTLPLLWAGLVAAATALTPVSLNDALWGVVWGYGSLWAVYWLFKLTTGKEGMGYGDFKLLAALGAWFGWQALIPMILMASVIGAVVGIAMKYTAGLREGGYVPFGPFLAGAALVIWLLGPQTVMRSIGL